MRFFYLSFLYKITVASRINAIAVLIWVKVIMFWFVWATEIPTKAHAITRVYAMSFRVTMTIDATKRAIIIIVDAQISVDIPKESHSMETNVVATLAIEAIVIQPKYVLKGS